MAGRAMTDEVIEVELDTIQLLAIALPTNEHGHVGYDPYIRAHSTLSGRQRIPTQRSTARTIRANRTLVIRHRVLADVVGVIWRRKH